MNPQPVEAGRKGGTHYSLRCQLKREIRSGAVKVTELLYEPDIPEHLKSLRVVELLDFVPYLTAPTYEPMLEEVPIKLTAVLSDTTYRKRRKLMEALVKWEKEPREFSGNRARRHYGDTKRAGKRQGGPRAVTV